MAQRIDRIILKNIDIEDLQETVCCMSAVLHFQRRFKDRFGIEDGIEMEFKQFKFYVYRNETAVVCYRMTEEELPKELWILKANSNWKNRKVVKKNVKN